MAATRPSAAHASVVFLKIPEFSQSPVAEQVRLKDRLEGAVAAALPCLDEAKRIVLEAADGAAVVVLGDPAAALQFAWRSSAGGIATGISHGPVRVAADGTHSILLGDGIVAADAVAGLAPRGRVVATREFRDALVRAAPGRARYLAPAGTHSDARDRSYELFLADEKAAAARRRRSILSLAAAAAVIVALGIAARMWLHPHSMPSGPPPSALAPAERAKPAPVVTPPAPPALATLRLDIRPQGDVFIDGVAKGHSPPLTSIQIPPGKHRIEVRRAGSSALVLQVDAGPGEELAIRHAFAPPPPKSAMRRFFDQFK